MSQPVSERFVSDAHFDDCVLPFAAEKLHLRGRLARLGPALDAIVKRHAYPDPVSFLIGEAVALTALLGSALKEQGRFQLQTRTDGIADMLVVDFDAPDRLRAFARFDAERLAQAGEGASPAVLLGAGHLGLTIDRGADMQRYQGVTPLAGEGLESAAHAYFAQSEQIPTLVRLAVGKELRGAESVWRAGGLIVQYLPQSEDRLRAGLESAEDAGDLWAEGRALAATLEPHELLDGSLSGERLLYRLFHENELRVFDPQPLRDQCRCSDAGVRSMLARFSSQEIQEMIGDDGRIGVTCEFCSTARSYDPAEFGAAGADPEE